MSKIKTYVVLHDLHYPKYNKKCFEAVLEFIKDRKPDGLIFAGDQFDNAEISHHNANKPLYRERGSYKRNTDNFDRDILRPLERSLGTKAERTWIVGNHDDWEFQFVETNPELEWVLDRPTLLHLEERGWELISIGHAKRLGELNVIHGEVLTGIGNQAGMYPSRKAVELYGSNVLAGHTHAPQSFAKISPVDHKKKYMGWIAPCLCDTNPDYLRNRPTAWVNGFTVVEVQPNGFFNVYPIMVFNGKFSFGGKLYGK